MITYVAYKIGEFMLDKIIMISKEAGAHGVIFPVRQAQTWLALMKGIPFVPFPQNVYPTVRSAWTGRAVNPTGIPFWNRVAS